MGAVAAVQDAQLISQVVMFHLLLRFFVRTPFPAIRGRASLDRWDGPFGDTGSEFELLEVVVVVAACALVLILRRFDARDDADGGVAERAPGVLLERLLEA